MKKFRKARGTSMEISKTFDDKNRVKHQQNKLRKK